MVERSYLPQPFQTAAGERKFIYCEKKDPTLNTVSTLFIDSQVTPPEGFSPAPLPPNSKVVVEKGIPVVVKKR
jgi:hypothetical protein